jgi:hypothetical protein
MDRSASTSEMQGRTALLAAGRTEELATRLLEQVQHALANGSPVLDLRATAEGA